MVENFNDEEDQQVSVLTCVKIEIPMVDGVVVVLPEQNVIISVVGVNVEINYVFNSVKGVSYNDFLVKMEDDTVMVVAERLVKVEKTDENYIVVNLKNYTVIIIKIVIIIIITIEVII